MNLFVFLIAELLKTWLEPNDGIKSSLSIVNGMDLDTPPGTLSPGKEVDHLYP